MKKKQFAKAQQYLNAVWSVAYLTPGLESTQDALTKQAKNRRNLNIKSKKEAVAELERQRAMVAQAAKEKARIDKEQQQKKRLAEAKKEQQRKALAAKKSQQKKAAKQVAKQEPSNKTLSTKRVAEMPAKNARPQNTARIDQLWKQAVEKRTPVGSYPLSDDKLAGRDRSILADLKEACQDIVSKKSSIVVEVADKSDYRWLIVRLTLCTRNLDKNFRLRHSYAEADEPKLTLYPPRSSSLLYDAAQ